MYIPPKDGYPDLPDFEGISVGDFVHTLWGNTIGCIVRIHQPIYKKVPQFTIEWLANGAIGTHWSENLVLYKTKAQWEHDVQ